MKLVAGLNALVEYPYGCTEQRLSLARGGLALKSFAPILAAAGLEDRVSANVKSTAQIIDQSIDADGLVAFWPRARGNVSLTAWSYDFLARAERAGEPIDKTLAGSSRQYPEIVAALRLSATAVGRGIARARRGAAALAEGGKLDDSYVAELARRADFLPNLSVAQMASAAARLAQCRSAHARGADRYDVEPREIREPQWRAGLCGTGGGERLADHSAFRDAQPRRNGARRGARRASGDPRANALRDALLRLGEGDGWGTTNADAAAIEALAEGWRRPTAPIGVTFNDGGQDRALTLDANTPVVRHVSSSDAPLKIANGSNAPLVAMIETSYMPAEPRRKGSGDERRLYDHARRAGASKAARRRKRSKFATAFCR